MKYLSGLFMTVLMSAGSLMAQEVLPVYPGAVPGAKPTPATYQETTVMREGRGASITKVSVPTLTVYRAAKEKANGTAVIICPGGGYSGLAIGHEGYPVAERFAAIGVTAFVLKYRLPSDEIMTDRSVGPLQDVEQAIYHVRKDAAKWGINPAKIGVMGFSAGGHLASSLTVHYKDLKIENKEGLSLRPDFSVLIYPVISFTESEHKGSAQNLAGTDAKLREYFSNDKYVNAETPPTFLIHANDDKTVPVQNSILFNQALVKANVKAEMHIYQAGGHGFGLNNKTTAEDWFKTLENWMRGNKFL
ncbi:MULTISPECIES: alpha/beta hydrolase [Pedobacter]|uniref:Esterase/lipase n=1 Tax=Pedobacter heparinus (strain ATCC 13125 / DSM 2366 / CIP 104194 / JCM 7457 / NBRC 12017 / NCIMB 9290 / NRRL B-14731 / HIM 762-3) TaxID=485917 RepID=C6XZ26_PEDHD|nr:MULTISPECIES: alpha/beta hydrolase [Pedobacter]ACU02508.1 esterase/lipase [Pedobacter heparinus DSM 2366]MBB5440196.1 acetyl esterase/lipase [Pedobacter sp. AK017]